MRTTIMPVQRNETDLEACRWAMLVEHGPLSPQQQFEFDQWMAASTRHAGAYHRAKAASVHFDRLGSLAVGLGDAGGRMPSIATRRGTIAAVVLAVGLVGAGTWLGGGWHPNLRSGRYVTAVGEMRRVGLTDGSEVVLNTASEVSVAYTGKRRALRLARGEALFTVVSDTSRPFLVYVGQLIVRATGSAFVIQRVDADIVHVTVTEGSIEMLWTDGVIREPWRLPANYQVTVGVNGVVETHLVSSDELQRQSSWLVGKIVFSGQPLHEAIREMNRYSQRHIVVEDAELAERPVSGAFRTADPQTFLSILQHNFDVEAVTSGDTVLLHPRLRSR
ncbi:MAG TPA: FecR domain-containing protein [Steroidobacteraceae bacterium]